VAFGGIEELGDSGCEVGQLPSDLCGGTARRRWPRQAKALRDVLNRRTIERAADRSAARVKQNPEIDAARIAEDGKSGVAPVEVV
jgi:hypothetical protein